LYFFEAEFLHPKVRSFLTLVFLLGAEKMVTQLEEQDADLLNVFLAQVKHCCLLQWLQVLTLGCFMGKNLTFDFRKI
jgi:hypothetical protein